MLIHKAIEYTVLAQCMRNLNKFVANYLTNVNNLLLQKYISIKESKKC